MYLVVCVRWGSRLGLAGSYLREPHQRRRRRQCKMRRARSVTGPLRRAHPASGATWNVQVVRGKMSSTCLWNACRALALGLLLMLLGSAMATIGYYADTLSVAVEIRGNATVSVKDEARGFHLNNLSYAGPIVMGFGGFIVVAACVMTFEARDSAAKVTPARPQSLPRIPISSGGAGRRTVAAACVAPARLDTLGVYRLPHALPHHRYRPSQAHARHKDSWRVQTQGMSRSLCGSAPELCTDVSKPPLLASGIRRPLRRYALSVDEPQSRAHVHSAAESECGSQSSLAMDLHGSGAAAGVTLRVRDNSRRRPLARQQRLHDDPMQQTASTSLSQTPSIDNTENYKNIVENAEKPELAQSRMLSPTSPTTPSSPLETILQIEELEEPDPPDKDSALAQLASDSLSDKQVSTDTPTDSDLTEIFVQTIKPTEPAENSEN